jgi:hypothetical protein
VKSAQISSDQLGHGFCLLKLFSGNSALKDVQKKYVLVGQDPFDPKKCVMKE